MKFKLGDNVKIDEVKYKEVNLIDSNRLDGHIRGRISDDGELEDRLKNKVMKIEMCVNDIDGRHGYILLGERYTWDERYLFSINRKPIKVKDLL